MDKERKKELREKYMNRHPDMGIVCWECDGRMWIATSKDAKADYNSTSFQLELGSWPNRELQKEYKEKKERFKWSLIRELEYEDYSEDHSEELEILLMEFLDEYPEAENMKPGKEIR